MAVPSAVDPQEPKAVVRAVMEGVSRLALGDQDDVEQLIGLYSDPTHVVHPMRPDVPAARGHADLRNHLGRILQPGGTPDSYRPIDVVTHMTSDPEVVVTEFSYEMVRNGTTVITPCIWVTRVRDGHVVEARDYNGTPTPIATS